jgi:hypothetical protein
MVSGILVGVAAGWCSALNGGYGCRRHPIAIIAVMTR